MNAAAVEKDVYSMAVFENGREKGAHGLFGGEVRGVDCNFSAERLDGLLGGLVGCVALSLGVSVDGLERDGCVESLLGREGCLLLLRRGQWP